MAASALQSSHSNGKVPLSTVSFISPIHKSNKPFPKYLYPKQNLSSSATAVFKQLQEERKTLPIYHYRRSLLDAIAAHDTVIVVGETGSGKTTQLPQYLYEAGYTKTGKKIGCTQPRRVAAISIANRVASEVCILPHTLVGYTIRFEDTTKPDTAIQYLTDGMLLRTLLSSPMLEEYTVIALDEAHERTLDTDVLCSQLKNVQKLRRINNNPLKLIVMSATLDSTVYTQYFAAPLLHIHGRSFPVTVYYTTEIQPDYIESAVTTVMQIHMKEKETSGGDILVFLPGQEDIENAQIMLEDKSKLLPISTLNTSFSPINLTDKNTYPTLLILPLFASLPPESQLAVFKQTPPHSRKIILSTNIAETSLTLPNITYVIDSGISKMRVYDSKRHIEELRLVQISQAEAWQRSGRAGRMNAGSAYRLYTEKTFENLLPSKIPEIQRVELSNVIMELKQLNVANILKVDWLTSPNRETVLESLETLLSLGALTNDGELSTLGSQMVQFPLLPLYSKALITSTGSDYNCSVEMLAIISMLSVENVYINNNRAKEKENRLKREKFVNSTGDHLTLLNIYNAYISAKNGINFCNSYALNHRTLHKATLIYSQLGGLLQRMKLPIVSTRNNGLNDNHTDNITSSNISDVNTETIRRCLTVSFFSHTACLNNNSYVAKDGSLVYIHPTSVIAELKKKKEFLLYDSIVSSTKKYMRYVTEIKNEWLIDLASQHFQVDNDIKSKTYLNNSNSNDNNINHSNVTAERLHGFREKKRKQLSQDLLNRIATNGKEKRGISNYSDTTDDDAKDNNNIIKTSSSSTQLNSSPHYPNVRKKPKIVFHGK